LIDPIWERLAAEHTPRRGEFHVLDAGAGVEDGQVLAALDVDGLRNLLVPIPPGVEVEPDLRSAGVHLRGVVLQDDSGRETPFVDLACRRRHLGDIFAHLADEVVRELRRNPRGGAAVCRTVLSRWRELLERGSGRALGLEALVGLFGELWYLRELLRINPTAAVRWDGPLGGRHDFVARRIALEIKATLRREGRFFEVHGAEQLQPPQGGVLYLAAVKLESSPGGESVPGLVEDVLGLCGDRLEVLRRLSAVGYDQRAADDYRAHLFEVREDRLYEVDDHFPRIVPSSFVGGGMPPGTIALRYTIDLSGPIPRASTDAAAAEVLRRIAEGTP
jgi:hypothetical protein